MVLKDIIIMRCKHRLSVVSDTTASAKENCKFIMSLYETSGTVINLKMSEAKLDKPTNHKCPLILYEQSSEYPIATYMSTDKPSNDYDSGYYGKREDTDRESWIGGCDETFRFHGFVVVSPSIVALGEVRGGNDVRGEKKRGAYDGIFIPRRSRKQELSGVYGYGQQFRNNGK